MSDSYIRYNLPEAYRTFYHFYDGELHISPNDENGEHIGRFYDSECNLMGTGTIIDEDLKRWKYEKGISILDAAILLNIEIEGITLFKIKVAEYGDIIIYFFVEDKPYTFNIYFKEPNQKDRLARFDDEIITVLFKPRSFIEQLLSVKDFIEKKVEELLSGNELIKVFADYKEIRLFELEIQKYLKTRGFEITYSDFDQEN